MRTLKLTIAYDGTRYAGWQRQRRGPTIQATLERVLRQILQEPVRAIGSGRTDAGVHAEAQVAHVKTRSALPCARILRSLNALLPPAVAVMRLEEAAPSFHARFSTSTKRYRYRIFTGPVVSPFLHPYVHHVPAPLDVPAMRREAAVLRTRQDFGAFARASSLKGSAVRTMTDVSVARRGQEIHVECEGDGFLHAMVRSIAGTLLDVGRGRLPPGTVRRMLRTKRRDLAGTTAPAGGLTLVSVHYR